MVTNEEIAELVKQTFPECPICKANSGYEISSYAKCYFQCNSCGAKWLSHDLVKRNIDEIKLKNAKLVEAARDGRGKSLTMKVNTVKFWKSLSDNRLEEIDHESRTKKIEPLFESEASVSQLEHSILDNLNEIATWDYGSTLYGKLGFVLDKSSCAEQATVRLLRAIFEQNKILIKQNELLRRELKQNMLLKRDPE